MAERTQLNGPIERIPAYIYDKLVPFYGRIDELLQTPLDYPHGPLHVAEVRLIARQLGEKRGLSLEELKELDQAALIHDAGYAFCQLGILKPKEHNFGSAFIAKELSFNDDQIKAILEHVKYNFKGVYGFHNTILRSADRLSGCGWSGAVREAYYLGVRHPFFDDQMKNKKSLVDLRRISKLPCIRTKLGIMSFREVIPDYESEVKSFFANSILPELDPLSRGRLQNRMILWYKQVLGTGKLVDVVDLNALDMFTQKLFNTAEAIEMLE